MAEEVRDYSGAQDQLAKALDTARAGEDRELGLRVREAGESFARCLTGVIRLVSIHDKDNQAFDAPVAMLKGAVEDLIEMLGAIHLVMVEGQVYINDIRVRFQSTDETGADLGKAFAVHKVGGFSIHRPASDSELRIFIKHMSTKPRENENPRKAFQFYLEAQKIDFIELAPLYKFRSSGGGEHAAANDYQKVYSRSIDLVSETWTNLLSERVPNPLPMRRLITDLIDMSKETQDEQMLTLAGDEDAQEYVRHTLAVSSLSILIGAAVGLPDSSLSDLGVAAMFHDIGYTMGEQEMHQGFEDHPVEAARVLLKQRGFHEAKIRRLLVALQHHKNFDAEPAPTLFAKIVRIADDYDTLTRQRSDGPFMAPPDALSLMYGASGSFYDPALIQVFVNKLGRYPPGSLLQLNDGRWVLSMTGVRSPEDFESPLCMVAREADGSFPVDEVEVDLAEEPSLWVAEVIRPVD
ncbi:MAG: HD domain-containing protein [Myxococcota bacterium]|nr:HD domain-containing protein [Myxococcota bacterium]